MVARVTSFRASNEALEYVVRVYEGEVVPWLEAAGGFCGMLILRAPRQERALALSFWVDAEALAAAEGALERFRKLVAETVGSTNLGIDEYEVALAAGLTLGRSGIPRKG